MTMEVDMLVLCLAVLLPSLFLSRVCFVLSFLPSASRPLFFAKRVINLPVGTSREDAKVLSSLRGIELMPHPFQCTSSSIVPSWLVTICRVMLPSQSLVSRALVLILPFLSFVIGTSGAAVDAMQRDASVQAPGGQNTIGPNEIIAIAIGIVAIFTSIGATVGVAIWQDRRRKAASLTLRNETDPESGSGLGERSLANDSEAAANSSGPQSLSLALRLEPVANPSQQSEVELDTIDDKHGKTEPAHADTEPPPEHPAAIEIPSVVSSPMLHIAP